MNKRLKGQRILVTGASGFIGQALIKEILSEGGNVLALSRTPVSLFQSKNVTFLSWDLSNGEKLELSEPIDKAIHLAHDFKKCETSLNNEEPNFRGTIALARKLANHRVGKQIFFSSQSATVGAQSRYGKIKLKIQDWCIENQIQVIRPSLVIGPGGLCLRLRKIARTSPLVIVPGGTELKLYVTGLDHVIETTLTMMLEKGPNIVDLWEGTPITLSGLIQALGQRHTFSPVIASLPHRPILNFLDGLEAVTGRSFGAENLRGLIGSQDFPPGTHPWQHSSLHSKARSLAELVVDNFKS